MIKRLIHCTILLMTALCLSDGIAQAQTRSNNEPNDNNVTDAVGLRFFDLLAQRRPARRAAFALMTSSNSFIGDSTIFESNAGLVGIGTAAPASRLTVDQPIQSLGIGFTSQNGMAKTATAAGPLFTVAHDATLVGEGTAGSPLGVAVPLILSGAVEIPFRGIINVRNTLGSGIRVRGGLQGEGVHAEGGDNDNGYGGDGVVAGGGVGSGAGYSGGIGIVVFHGFGVDGANDSRAGLFFGDVAVSGGDVAITGTLSKGGGSFKIDHPLDPENKYLSHSFVESPDMKNIYDGNVTTDENGEATVTLPDYFQALNRDFRYQLTVIGTFAQAIVAEKINGNSFMIRTSAPAVEVSWQVTGIRQDGWANRNRIPVEEDKPEVERGYYLYPKAFDQPDEKSVNWARYPEMMQRKQQRAAAAQSRKRAQR